MTQQSLQLQHFYFGHATKDGQMNPKRQILALSSGIDPKLARQTIEHIRLEVDPSVDRGTWAFIKGRSRQMPYLFVQAMMVSEAHMMAHYVVATPDVIRGMGGNLDGLKQLVRDKFPSFERAGRPLPALTLDVPDALSVDEQVDQMLELMTITKNRTASLQAMLGGLVNNVPMRVLNAPPDLDSRIVFIKGLLALMPSSVRFGVTFSTHCDEQEAIDAQICFYQGMTADEFDDNVQVFDWETAKISGSQIKNDYSQYIISQLRLDPSLVVQHNIAMGSIAGWRLKQGDNIADSLSYASKRLRADTMLRDNQPVSRDEVAQILKYDPTLSTDLQLLYAGHLVRLSLVMEDMSDVEPVAMLLRDNAALEDSILSQMQTALDEGNAWLIYDTLLDWLRNPFGPQGKDWITLTHNAVFGYLRDMVKERDVEEIQQILQDVTSAGPAVDLTDLVPRLVKLVLPASQADARIAEHLFLLGVRYLPDDPFKQLMNLERFRAKLNPQIGRAWAYIFSKDIEKIDPRALVQAAREFGESWEALILLRFAEFAYREERYDLLQAPTLSVLCQLAQSGDAAEYSLRLRRVVTTLEREVLKEIPEAARRYFLEIHLALGDYRDLGRQIITQLALYPVEDQEDFLAMLAKVFAGVTVPLVDVPEALLAIGESGVKGVPMMLVKLGIVQGHLGTDEVDEIVDEVTSQLSGNRYLADVMPPDAILGLLQHYSKRRDVAGVEALTNLVSVALHMMGNKGVRRLAEIYKEMNWDDDIRRAGLMTIQAFIRQQTPEMASKITAYFGKETGASVKRSLDVTLLFYNLMGHREFPQYAEDVKEAMAFMQRVMELYIDPKAAPSLNTLLNGLSGIEGVAGIPSQKFNAFKSQMLTASKSITLLGKQQHDARGRNYKNHIKSVLSTEQPPRSTLELLIAMSGELSDGERYNVRVFPTTSLHPLDTFTLANTMAGFAALDRVLTSAAKALPLSQPPRVKPDEITSEVESLYRSYQIPAGDPTLRDLSRNLQYLVDLVMMAYDSGDLKVVDDSTLARKIESGKQTPQSVLAFFRFLHGYFRS